jgi:hypothetical protein
VFDIKDPTLDCLPPAPLILDDYSTTKCNRNDKKLVRLSILMLLSRGLMGMAHLGRQQIKSTRFATGIENWPK